MSVTGIHIDDLRPVGSPQAGTKLSKLHEAVSQLVGLTFFETMLQMAHDSAFKGKYGHGGRGEEIFTQRMDSLLAERLGASGRFGLVDAIYQRFAKRVENEEAGSPQADQQEHRIEVTG